MLSARIKSFVDNVSAASRPAEVGEALRRVATELGFADYLLFDAAKLSARIDHAIVAGTPRAKSGVIAHERGVPLGAHPIIQAARKSDRPVRCESLRESLGINGREWRKALPERPSEARRGVIVPVHRGGELVLLLNLVGETPDDSPVAQAALHLCAHVVYDRLWLLRQAERENRILTKREAACMFWVTEGKTDVEIGDILDIAPRTVRFHIANAKRKLGAASRLEAVAKKVADFER